MVISALVAHHALGIHISGFEWLLLGAVAALIFVVKAKY